jgi:hypothetical protein
MANPGDSSSTSSRKRARNESSGTPQGAGSAAPPIVTPARDDDTDTGSESDPELADIKEAFNSLSKPQQAAFTVHLLQQQSINVQVGGGSAKRSSVPNLVKTVVAVGAAFVLHSQAVTSVDKKDKEQVLQEKAAINMFDLIVASNFRNPRQAPTSAGIAGEHDCFGIDCCHFALSNIAELLVAGAAVN